MFLLLCFALCIEPLTCQDYLRCLDLPFLPFLSFPLSLFVFSSPFLSFLFSSFSFLPFLFLFFPCALLVLLLSSFLFSLPPPLLFLFFFLFSFFFFFFFLFFFLFLFLPLSSFFLSFLSFSLSLPFFSFPPSPLLSLLSLPRLSPSFFRSFFAPLLSSFVFCCPLRLSSSLSTFLVIVVLEVSNPAGSHHSPLLRSYGSLSFSSPSFPSGWKQTFAQLPCVECPLPP